MSIDPTICFNHRPSYDIYSWKKVLSSSPIVLALCGAGLGASSGLDTFRGPGGMWQDYLVELLATLGAFSLAAGPNKGHFALAELARKTRKRGEEGFLCLTQNVDE
ncbi:hypothetical protein DSL72_007465 [Monilinia vaccinii-corymbosi]|uniref:Deacetylase sirtuin-type domain-containing protein n=1 Tax=Monilinia vaccinii-corymbosi TaxID=61207 RepID=A0A8A3PN35_9HELO|nr:hypothetical protein DSL72_007465 [Monilinia vaccinii-corymbosi]